MQQPWAIVMTALTSLLVLTSWEGDEAVAVVEACGCLVAQNSVGSPDGEWSNVGAMARMGQPNHTKAGRNDKRAWDAERYHGWLSGKSSGGQKS